MSALGDVDSAALTLRATSRAQEMLGASDEWGAGLEEAQYTLGEGPGATAFTTGRHVLVSDLRGEQERWPSFADAAMSVGASAAFAFPLRIGAIRVGTLDLYRRRVGGLAERVATDAATLADLATLAVIEHSEPSEPGSKNWTRPAVSYQEVNMATGMLAAQLRISLDDAFARLRAHGLRRGSLDPRCRPRRAGQANPRRAVGGLTALTRGFRQIGTVCWESCPMRRSPSTGSPRSPPCWSTTPKWPPWGA